MWDDGSISDSALLADIRNDDAKAFEMLYERYWAQVYTAISRRLPDEEIAKDIVQNVFMKLWTSNHIIVVHDSIAPYLLSAARKQAINFYKKNKADLLREADYQQQDIERWSPDLSLEAKELERFLEHEISTLPESMRKSFVLSRMEDKSIKDIAAELSLSEQTIKNNISIALNLLRKRARHFLSSPVSISIFFSILFTKN